ncbi:hypothetical protein [uncultured phage_MedDCM-OCT-S45-C4]|uniref:Internal virion protein n=1 Tax=uncultured phage_MedDCM-OCT-S45-C4 TaxID=2740801 RepID=A0A6S4P7M9_9CAUD|nr:hypothetical protein HOQ58_gp30 [uncultured phage_MedDCM-OCT-S45-C4]BAQ93971.1 hypothetical protein [uncultured phage_MedDCM-OCT-S45-C4]
MAIGAALGIASGVMSMFGGRKDNSAQIGAQAYQNTLSRRKTQIMNDYRERAYERTVQQVYKQFDENYAAANASFQTEQAKFAEQMMSFAFQKEGLLRQLDEAEGYAAATESYGKSADRARAIKTLGDYGRNNAKFVESISSAQRQYGRNVGGISGALDQANLATSQPIIGGAPIAELEARGYNAPIQSGGGFFNTAMKIMGGVQTGLSMYKQADMAFNADSKFLPSK